MQNTTAAIPFDLLQKVGFMALDVFLIRRFTNVFFMRIAFIVSARDNMLPFMTYAILILYSIS